MENDTIEMPVINIFPAEDVSVVELMSTDSLVISQSTAHIDTWLEGKTVADRNVSTQPDSWLLTLFVVLLALIALGARNFRHIFGSLDTELIGVRRRANAFESHTASESRTLLLLVLTGCCCEAVLLGYYFRPSVLAAPLLLGALAGLMIVFYLFQVIAYNILGFTFTDKVNTAQLIKGLNLSTGLTALILLVPTLLLIFYQNVTTQILIMAGLIYILGRIAFICKGFRIFYNGLSSLVYFILYLCALEIIPVILVSTAALRLCTLL